MTWMKSIKQSLGSIVVISSMLMCSHAVLAKKIEPDKTMTNKHFQEEKTLPAGVDNIAQVNINQASAEELAKKLHGIGIQKAKAIVEYRNTYGAFNTIENILEVRGIGPVFLEKNRSKLTL